MITLRTILAVLFSLCLVSGQAVAGSNKKPCKRGEADYIIVGLGTAGSVLARHLSDPVKGKFKNSVLVLEAGQNRSNDPVIQQGPAFLFNNLDELSFNPKYAITKIVPDPIVPPLAGNELFSSGRMWFGTSAHYFMGCVHGSSDRWNDLAAAVGDSQWSYNNLLPFMKALETFNGTTTTPADRGFNGPLQVSQMSPVPTVSDPFPVAISAVTGAPITSDYNVPAGDTAVSVGQMYSTPDFQKRSYAFDFLPKSVLSFKGKGKQGRNLQVFSGANVNRVIFDGKKAVGVEYFLDNNQDRVYIAYAKKKVILCAGVPFSAAILQRSGVGPATVLQQPEVDIPVLVDNPLVGTGLKTHYGVAYTMTPPAQPFAIPLFSVIDGRNFFGPAVTGDNKRRFELMWSNGFPISLLAPAIANLLPSPGGLSGTGWNLRPRSSGTAYIVDANPFTLPDIRFNFYTDGDLSDPASDLSASVAMFKIANAVAIASGTTIVYPPPSHFSSDATLASDAIGLLAYSAFTVTNHYSGTCNMGSDISSGVVSSHDLHVFGTRNLLVVDNSIYPFPETGNTAWQAYLAGIKAANILGAFAP